MNDFHFSPRPNRAAEIHWRTWGEEAFDEAAARDVPILLSISAVWCHWCHVMDETTFSDPGVISLLNEAYVPVRVDNDQRPDINRRYNMGGWPTVAFLTPEGDTLTGATYVPAAQFQSLLARVGELWDSRREDIRAEIAAHRAQHEEAEGSATPTGEADESLVTRVFAALAASFDRQYGGFGTGMKFPRLDALDLLLLHTDTRPAQGAPRQMLSLTIDNMRDGDLWDPVERGFFRYATRRDWTVPHYEKMLEDNAGLIRILAQAAMLLDRPDYLHTAREAQAYLDERLWQDEAAGYGGSQDADEDYYALSDLEARRRLPLPYVDPTVYTDWNAQAVRGLIALYAAGGDPVYLERAVAVADMLLGRRTERGLFLHDGAHGGADHLLDDQLSALEMLLDLSQATGNSRWLAEALDLWQAVDKAAPAAQGPLVTDTLQAAGDPLGRLRDVETPPAENARLAAALLSLGRMTRDEVLLDRARAILDSLAPLADSLGDFGGELGRAALGRLEEPVHVTVVGRRGALDTAQLVDEALRMPRVHRLVDVLDPETDRAILEAAGMSGDESGAQAYLCAGTRCLEPATTTEDLRQLLEDVAEP